MPTSVLSASTSESVNSTASSGTLGKPRARQKRRAR